jgi:hypothetical protein
MGVPPWPSLDTANSLAMYWPISAGGVDAIDDGGRAAQKVGVVAQGIRGNQPTRHSPPPAWDAIRRCLIEDRVLGLGPILEEH